MSTEIMLQGEIRPGRRAETCSKSEIWRGSSLSLAVFENISFHVRICVDYHSNLIQIDVSSVLDEKGLCVYIRFRYLTEDSILINIT
jgi:hypothetical protein